MSLTYTWQVEFAFTSGEAEKGWISGNPKQQAETKSHCTGASRLHQVFIVGMVWQGGFLKNGDSTKGARVWEPLDPNKPLHDPSSPPFDDHIYPIML